ncbi:MAG: NUDIX domain-containing protein [Treponema sp.]|nr:NUDIX domain-containing protein [Treponema sp.]
MNETHNNSGINIDSIDWKVWTPDEKSVIVFIIDKKQNRTLLIHKKTGLGAGKINAPGGRIEKGETAAQAAVRECREEVSMTPLGLQKRAELYFHFTTGYRLYCEAFISNAWEGEPANSYEAEPFWCGLGDIPWEKMWEDDRDWLPSAIDGKKVKGYFIFNDDDMIAEKLEEVKNFES